MSGDVSRVKQRKAVKGKSAAVDTNGTKKMRVVESGSSGGASILTKLVFWSLLASLGVTLTVVYVDYQPGQLKAAYTKYIPPEVSRFFNQNVRSSKKSFVLSLHCSVFTS